MSPARRLARQQARLTKTSSNQVRQQLLLDSKHTQSDAVPSSERDTYQQQAPPASEIRRASSSSRSSSRDATAHDDHEYKQIHSIDIAAASSEEAADANHEHGMSSRGRALGEQLSPKPHTTIAEPDISSIASIVTMPASANPPASRPESVSPSPPSSLDKHSPTHPSSPVSASAPPAGASSRGDATHAALLSSPTERSTHMWVAPSLAAIPTTSASTATAPPASPETVDIRRSTKPLVQHAGLSIASEPFAALAAAGHAFSSSSLSSSAPSAAIVGALVGPKNYQSALALAHAGRSAVKGLYAAAVQHAKASGFAPPLEQEQAQAQLEEAGLSDAGRRDGVRTVQAAAHPRFFEDFANTAAPSTASTPAAQLTQQRLVAWSHWDKLGSVSFLLIGYKDGSLQVWRKEGCTRLDEVLRLPPAFLHSKEQAKAEAHGGECMEILSARLRWRNCSSRDGEGTDSGNADRELRLLAVVATRAPATATGFLLLELELATGKIVQSAPLASSPTSASATSAAYASMRFSANFIIIALSTVDCAWSSRASSPATDSSIHIHSSRTLMQLHSPLRDTAQPFADRAPAFDISGRLLAYASTKPAAAASSAALSFGAGSSARLHRRGRREDAAVVSPPLLSASCSLSGSGTAADRESASASATAGLGATTQQQQQQLYDVAKRVGGSVFSGAKALGSMGADYLGGVADPAAAVAGRERRMMQQLQTTANASTQLFTAQRTCIRVLDLGSPGNQEGQPAPALRAVAHFSQARQQPLALLRFNPTGEMLFSADVLGRVFQVYAVDAKFSVRAGVAAAPAPAAGLAQDEPIYKITRGLTNAHVADAQWSRDSHLLFVCTKRGTTHIAALNPHGGGPVDVSAVLQGRCTQSPLLLASSSSLFGAVARAPSAASMMPPPPPCTTISVAAHASASAALTMTVADRTESDSDATRVASAWPCIAVMRDRPGKDARTARIVNFNGATGHLLQNKAKLTFQHQHPRRPSSSSASSSPSHVSGLTEMLRKSAFGDRHNAHSFAYLVSSPATELPALAWPRVTRHVEQSVAVLGLSADRDASYMPSRAHARSHSSSRPWVSGAEIETYIKLPRAMPSHIYICPQMQFSTYANPPLAIQYACDAHRTAVEPLRVRTGVEMTPFGDADSFDADLGSAILQAGWDREALAAAGVGTTIPSFPQGLPARSPTWTQNVSKGIPIRSVAGGIGEGMQRARSGLGRSMEVVRKFSSPHDHGKPKGKGTSLSFDDAEYDERTFAEAVSSEANKSLLSDSLSQRGGAGSAETPLTAISSGPSDEEFDKEDPAWDLARGTAEDVEGDELGWDTFALPDCVGASSGRNGLKRLGTVNKPSVSPDRQEEFLIGDFDEFDDGSASIPCPPQVASSLPPVKAQGLPPTNSSNMDTDKSAFTPSSLGSQGVLKDKRRKKRLAM
ncbi:hypothetical protein K437DRAFT_270778 [Tilletiaria anomala UBC 951]|uniref:BCAS3 WD40 domain-containing protein n=1 Tax=Tilletiaria anomala (strain ATCC 24038 / CBS 436.72 / UBC 951) TaxID=1037660 RepID=A0A066V7P1_TILAU|nr:uncharacterized protein K437DRAFT_270778 [Tilletiaria anomala UBC 951]KDN37747.1 hypothetical protein K437DRAFT_270778 [Tilletiaria anomala UBC 951]